MDLGFAVPEPLSCDPAWKRFVSNLRLDVETGCLIWTGRVTKKGYGQFHPRHGTTAYAHVYSFRSIRGDVPSGCELHHNECNNKGCVHPFHVEPITHSAHQALHRGTLCRKGLHPLSGDNLIIREVPGRAPLRTCRQCGRDRALRRYHERKQSTARRSA